jgi:hypothetical protein
LEVNGVFEFEFGDVKMLSLEKWIKFEGQLHL